MSLVIWFGAFLDVHYIIGALLLMGVLHYAVNLPLKVYAISVTALVTLVRGYPPDDLGYLSDEGAIDDDKAES